MMQVVVVTLIAGLSDGLNPIALIQQFILQSKTKPKHSILYYIFGIGITNFIFGCLYYFGLAQIIADIGLTLHQKFPLFLPIILLFLGFYLMRKAYQMYFKTNKKEKISNESISKTEGGKLNPIQLFLTGVISCLAELTSAAPYIAYLTYLIFIDINPAFAFLLILFYNLFLFNWPLFLMYFASVFFHSSLLRIYNKISGVLDFFINKILPILLVIIGIFLIVLALRIYGLKDFLFF